MRPMLAFVLLCALVGVIGTSAPAQAGQNPATCVRLAHQLVHYDKMKHRAADLGNAMWVKRFEQHIKVLEGRHAASCPNSAAANANAQQLRDLLMMAMQGAITFFTFGAY